ncbi:hypothetical protein HMPREF9996_02181 [Aggregatibacter actinomycetemcomitans Y4]|nr:hypothetical protein HMPREF9996_02181 [Aggregatibacter actinomycetemcomitans Y4]
MSYSRLDNAQRDEQRSNEYITDNGKSAVVFTRVFLTTKK